MRVGGYSAHFYCDAYDVAPGQVVDQVGHKHDEFPHQFYAETGADCDRQARARGWLVGRDRVLCPRCSGKAGVKR